MAKVTVWYDGACPLCIREIALMRWLDAQHSIEFLDIAPADAVCPLDRQLMLARFHASEDGVILSGAAAFAAMEAEEALQRRVPIMLSITLTDLAGDNDHWAAHVTSSAFEGISRVRQHQMVYAALGGRMGGVLHALQLTTTTPART